MTVAAILRYKGHDVASVPPVTKLSEVAVALTNQRIGAVLVLDAAGQMLGIVSERDIIRCVAHDGHQGLEKTAAQVMTRVLHTVTPTTTTDHAMAMMTNNRVRHLPVLDNQQLVGLVSIGDVVKARLEEQAQEVDSLTAYVAGSA